MKNNIILNEKSINEKKQNINTNKSILEFVTYYPETKNFFSKKQNSIVNLVLLNKNLEKIEKNFYIEVSVIFLITKILIDINRIFDNFSNNIEKVKRKKSGNILKTIRKVLKVPINIKLLELYIYCYNKKILSKIESNWKKLNKL